MNKKTLYCLIGTSCIILLVSVVYRIIYDEEKAIQEYFFALNNKDYAKVFEYVYSVREPFNEKSAFINQMNTIYNNKQLYKNSYLEFIKNGRITDIEICPIGYSKPEEKEYLQDASLIELGAWVFHEHFDKKVNVLEYLRQFGVKITVIDKVGTAKTFNTVIALKKSNGLLESILPKYKIVDPCILRTIFIYVSSGTDVEIDEVKACKDKDFDTYIGYEVLPGIHKVKLHHPNKGNYEKNIIVTSAILETGMYHLEEDF